MFSSKTFQFLIENRLNNSKEWYLEHKSDYEHYLLMPLIALSTSLTSTVNAIDDQIITVSRVNKTISRIYRDTRFSKDKSLYREDFWLSFKRDKKCYPNYPELFFVATPNCYLYGTGYYEMSSESLECMRELIMQGDPMFKNALLALNSRPDFIIDGDKYKRSRHPDQPEYLREWLDRKYISIQVKSDNFAELYEGKIADKIIDAYNHMEPIYKFFVFVETKVRDKITY